MRAPNGPIRARCDRDGRLLEADEPLSGLQLRNGGEIPGPLAVPALLSLIRTAQKNNIKLSRTIRMLDDGTEVSAWASVEPVASGCLIELGQWRIGGALAQPEDGEAENDLIRHLAEGYAWLDGNQRILAADLQAEDLAQLQAALSDGQGRPWTDFVEITGIAHRQPLHWRLLDRATVRVAGSDRMWRAHILPRPGMPGTGFELCLVPDSIRELPEASPDTGPVREDYGDLLGRELAPALRLPIDRIIANARSIQTRLAGPVADQYSTYAADIVHAGGHLLDLVDDLADLEAVESADFQPACEAIDLAEAGRQAAAMLSVKADERQMTLHLPASGLAVPAVGELRRVLQILLNLISNAIRYSTEGTEITVSCGVGSAGHSWISVQDQGLGMDRQQAAKAFAKFERLGRKGDGGSGLGLYISRRLARAMGGELSVESEPGKGACFTLTLPRRG